MILWALAAAWACGGLRGGCGPGVCLQGRCYCQAPFTGPHCAGRVELPALSALERPEAEVAPAPDPCAAGVAPALARLCQHGTRPAVPAAPPAVPAAASQLARPEANVRAPRALTPDHPIPPGMTSSRWAHDAEVLLLRTVDSPLTETIEDTNHWARFVSYFLVVLLILGICCAATVFVRMHKEFQRRLMFFISGDTKLRVNYPDTFLGTSILPSSIFRIEKMIVQDVDAGFFGLDLYVEVDWGANMLQSTRVRQVQPVNQMLDVMKTIQQAKMPCPKGHRLRDVTQLNEVCQKCGEFRGKPAAVWGCKQCEYYVCDRHAEVPEPKENQTVFTDHLEFNLRPYGQDGMKIRVVDQDIIGSETVAQLELTNDEVKALAERSIGRPLDLSCVGVFPLSLDGQATGTTQSRMLIWITLVDEYGQRQM